MQLLWFEVVWDNDDEMAFDNLLVHHLMKRAVLCKSHCLLVCHLFAHCSPLWFERVRTVTWCWFGRAHCQAQQREVLKNYCGDNFEK